MRSLSVWIAARLLVAALLAALVLAGPAVARMADDDKGARQTCKDGDDACKGAADVGAAVTGEQTGVVLGGVRDDGPGSKCVQCPAVQPVCQSNFCPSGYFCLYVQQTCFSCTFMVCAPALPAPPPPSPLPSPLPSAAASRSPAPAASKAAGASPATAATSPSPKASATPSPSACVLCLGGVPSCPVCSGDSFCVYQPATCFSCARAVCRSRTDIAFPSGTPTPSAAASCVACNATQINPQCPPCGPKQFCLVQAPSCASCSVARCVNNTAAFIDSFGMNGSSTGTDAPFTAAASSAPNPLFMYIGVGVGVAAGVAILVFGVFYLKDRFIDQESVPKASFTSAPDSVEIAYAYQDPHPRAAFTTPQNPYPRASFTTPQESSIQISYSH